MKFKVGDIIMPKKRDGPERWYDVVYRVVKIYSDRVVELEVIPRSGSFEEIGDAVRRDIDIELEGWPIWVSVDVSVNIEKTFVDVVFDEDDWVLVDAEG